MLLHIRRRFSCEGHDRDISWPRNSFYLHTALVACLFYIVPLFNYVQSKGFAPPPPCPPGMRMLPDARPLRGGCLFVVALKAAAGAPRGGGGISTKNETAKKACKTPPSTPKDPRETPKTTNHDGTVAPSGRPWPRTKDPKGAPKTPLGHRGGRQNSAKQKLRAP